MLHPKLYRTIRQSLAMALIWLFFGLVYVLLEYGILGRTTLYPTTGNQYDFESSLVFTAGGSFLMGAIQGWIEVTWLRKQFEDKALWIKLLLKGTFYLALIILFIILLAWCVNVRRFDTYPTDPVILQSLWHFYSNFAFWSSVIYVAVALGIALFFSEISQYLGIGVLYNFMLGKYHRPRKERRIFMFLDMRSSTSIAEKIGHQQYFLLLRSYYADMTEAILETSGQIYQYVGDEVVISWPENKGLYRNNCLLCLRGIDDKIASRAGYYQDKFGVVPAFKAGIHLGEVTVGEIGIIKKDIIYTGDVLNTTARIQAKCDEFNAQTLGSEELVNSLSTEGNFSFSRIGSLRLRGKSKAVGLYRIDFIDSKNDLIIK